jgi:hypothetical protein
VEVKGTYVKAASLEAGSAINVRHDGALCSRVLERKDVDTIDGLLLMLYCLSDRGCYWLEFWPHEEVCISP